MVIAASLAFKDHAFVPRFWTWIAGAGLVIGGAAPLFMLLRYFSRRWDLIKDAGTMRRKAIFWALEVPLISLIVLTLAAWAVLIGLTFCVMHPIAESSVNG